MIPSACHRLLILIPALVGIEGEARVTVGAEASSNGGFCGAFSLARGLVDGHVLDTLLCRGVLAGVGPTLPRHRALCLLSHRALKERAQLVVGTMRLWRCRFRESLEQSCYGSDVLTCPGEEWGSLVIFEDPLVYVAGVGACAPTASATCNLMLMFTVFLL
jgi:hypothetical protein